MRMCEAPRQEAAWLRAGLGGPCEEHSDGQPSPGEARPAERVVKTEAVSAWAPEQWAPKETVRQGKVTSWGGWGTE